MLFAIGFTTQLQLVAQTTEYKINFNSPISVVKAIPEAVKSGDYKMLRCLCDPLEEGDGDTKRICSLLELSNNIKAGGTDLETRFTRYVEGLKNIQVFDTTYIDEKHVFVKIKINGRDEEMNMICRYGNWYLSSF